MINLSANKTTALISNIAVIIGIIILVLEVRQANQIAITQSEISIRNSFQERHREIYANPYVAKLLTKQVDEEWSAEEEIRMGYFVSEILNLWLGIETACSNGMAAPETCEEVKYDIQNTLTDRPAQRPFFRYIVDSYPSMANTEVAKTINRVLEEYDR